MINDNDHDNNILIWLILLSVCPLRFHQMLYESMNICIFISPIILLETHFLFQSTSHASFYKLWEKSSNKNKTAILSCIQKYILIHIFG